MVSSVTHDHRERRLREEDAARGRDVPKLVIPPTTGDTPDTPDNPPELMGVGANVPLNPDMPPALAGVGLLDPDNPPALAGVGADIPLNPSKRSISWSNVEVDA